MQAEPRAALSLAARGESPLLKLSASDLVLYSAKVRPPASHAVPTCCVTFKGFTASLLEPCESISTLMSSLPEAGLISTHTWLVRTFFARAPHGCCLQMCIMRFPASPRHG